MTAEKLFWSLLVIVLVTVFTRAVPFLFFRSGEAPPRMAYVGRYLPPAIITIIVVYCLLAARFTVPPYGLPEVIASAVVVLVHLWKRNFLLSILGGTAVYMLLLRGAFF